MKNEMNNKVSARTLAKLEKWKSANVWSRIEINFTSLELKALEAAGLIIIGPFCSFEAI